MICSLTSSERSAARLRAQRRPHLAHWPAAATQQCAPARCVGCLQELEWPVGSVAQGITELLANSRGSHFAGVRAERLADVYYGSRHKESETST